MKKTIKFSGIAAMLIGLIVSCEPVQLVEPVPNTNSSHLSAKFLFVNASPDAPSLDFYINNVLIDKDITVGGYKPYKWDSITTNTGANTRFNVKADSGTLGILGSNGLIFRSTSTGVANFGALSGGFYTVMVLDTIKRPKPIRTVNKTGFGDVTYYAPATSVKGKSLANADTVIQLSSDYSNSIDVYNFCLSRQVPASFFTPLGQSGSGGAPGTAVPLGSTDPGGVRFLVVTDYLPSPATSPVWPVVTSGKFAARFINASPDAGTAACTINAVSVTGQTSYPLTAANFNPTVGSRSTSGSNPFTVGFKTDVTTTGSYSVSVTGGFTTVNSPSYTFADKGVYTVVLTGSKAKNTLAVTVIRNK